MTDKKIPKRYTKDQEKHNHREAFKGHRTKKHYINEIEATEAEQNILNESNYRRKPGLD